jgi:hypothetical protein
VSGAVVRHALRGMITATAAAGAVSAEAGDAGPSSG